MFSQKKRNEIVAFLWLTLAFLLFLSLVSYNPFDTVFQVSQPNQPIKNWVGPVGAHISWALHFAIGHGSYFLCFLFVLWAIEQWSEKKRQPIWLKVLAGFVFFVSSCASLSLFFISEPSRMYWSGGLVGYFTGTLLRDMFGHAAILVSLSLFMLSLLLTTEFLFFPLLISLWDKAYEAWTSRPVKPKVNKAESLLKARALEKEKMKEKEKEKQKDKEISSAPVAAIMPPKIKHTLNQLKDTFAGKAKLVEPPASPIKIKKREVAPPPKKAVSETPPPPRMKGAFKLPDVDLLADPKQTHSAEEIESAIEQQSHILQDTLEDFGVEAKVVEVEQGPVITRFELQPASGVKLQRFTALQDNLALALHATSVRILAPIPGKGRIGIEIPNPVKQMVTLKEVILSDEFQNSKSKLSIGIGKDVAGTPLVTSIDRMPHLLIAGSTGSGKTVCVNTLIMSILYRSTPDEVKFIMIDPKMVEFSCYQGLPHLLTPVITEVDRVPTALGWLINEMERRYRVCKKIGARNILSFNEKVDHSKKDKPKEGEEVFEKMPYIVLIIDELADLMMTAGKEVEAAIMRLAQLSRAVGIHLILATQRPSVDVITGVIKANFPGRIAFKVASKVDSRTVLDQNGAECLLGQGDLLFQDPAKPYLIRGQGGYLSDEEINKTVESWKNQQEPIYNEEVLKPQAEKKKGGQQDFRDDEYYEEACKVIVSSGQASVSLLQRRLGLGYTRAARLMDMMEEDGIVGPMKGTKGRDILVSLDSLDEIFKGRGNPEHAAGES